jgi:hypothetical protein
MPSYVLQDQSTLKFLQKTDAWGHTLTDDLQKARIYITEKDARRTATNKPRYANGDLPSFKIKMIKIVLEE